jgi:hypothetical protein
MLRWMHNHLPVYLFPTYRITKFIAQLCSERADPHDKTIKLQEVTKDFAVTAESKLRRALFRPKSREPGLRFLHP